MELHEGRTFRGSRLEFLVRDRTRFTILLAVLILAAIATAALDLWVGEDAPRWFRLGLQLSYGVYASLLATLLISRIVIASQIAALRNTAYAALGLLGIVPALEDQRVAIVVSAFPIDAEPGGSDIHKVREALELQMGMRPPHVLLKELHDIGDYAYSRRDILLAIDLVRLVAVAGLPQPHIVSDIDFCRSVQKAKETGTLPAIRSDSSDPGSLVTLKAAVIVGLWSNAAACVLSENIHVPFQLHGQGDDRQIALTILNARHPQKYPSVLGREEIDAAHALLARFYFDDFTTVVLGGIRALGTARLGDLIGERPTGCQEIFDTDPKADFWTVVACPGKGGRHEPIGVLTRQESLGYIRHRIPHFADVVDPDLREGAEIDLTQSDELILEEIKPEPDQPRKSKRRSKRSHPRS